GRGEDASADRVEQVATTLGVGHHLDLGALDGFFQRRIGVGGDHPEDREEGQRRDQAARQNDRLAADLVGQYAEHDEEAGTEQQRPGDQEVGGVTVDLKDRLQEEQRVELAGVPDHALAHHAADQGNEDELGVAPVGEGFGQRGLGALTLVLHLLEDRRFVQFQPDDDGHAEQDNRQQERDAPAP